MPVGEPRPDRHAKGKVRDFRGEVWGERAVVALFWLVWGPVTTR